MSDDGAMKKAGAAGGFAVMALGAAARLGEVGGGAAKVVAVGAHAGEVAVVGARAGEVVVGGAAVGKAAHGAEIAVGGASKAGTIGGQAARGVQGVGAAERVAVESMAGGRVAFVGAEAAVDAARVPRMRVWQTAGFDAVPLARGSSTELRATTLLDAGASQAGHSEIEMLGDVSGHVIDISQLVPDTSPSTKDENGAPIARRVVPRPLASFPGTFGFLALDRSAVLPRSELPSRARVTGPAPTPSVLLAQLGGGLSTDDPFTIVGHRRASGMLAVGDGDVSVDEVLAACATRGDVCFVLSCAEESAAVCMPAASRLWLSAASSLEASTPRAGVVFPAAQVREEIDTMARVFSSGRKSNPSLSSLSIAHIGLDEQGNFYLVRTSGS